MDEVTISRITVEQEADWLRVQDNFAKGLQSSMEARLSSLPGGKDGAEATAVRKELEHRIKKVSHAALLGRHLLNNRSKRRRFVWRNLISE
jgi:hypothetical protein